MGPVVVGVVAVDIPVMVYGDMLNSHEPGFNITGLGHLLMELHKPLLPLLIQEAVDCHLRELQVIRAEVLTIVCFLYDLTG